MAGLEGMRLGDYHILRRLGSGGMGDIYLAEQAELGRRVAVKVVREERLGDEQARERANRRFAQEARAVAALEHPHILPLYGYGEQDGIHYFAMQYVPDGSLADLLAPGPLHRFDLPLAPALAIVVLDQAAEALQYAHDHGVIHRDVKPHNLLVRVLSWPGEPQSAAGGGAEAWAGATRQLAGNAPQLHLLLADFGLARFIDGAGGRTGTVGTPLYSAPEQYNGTLVPATDQYALACVAYLLLAGRPVFDGTVSELHHQHLVAPPPPISRANATLPPALDAVLLRALAKDPHARYPTIRGFAQAVAAALRQGEAPPGPSPRPLGRPEVPNAASSLLLAPWAVTAKPAPLAPPPGPPESPPAPGGGRPPDAPTQSSAGGRPPDAPTSSPLAPLLRDDAARAPGAAAAPFTAPSAPPSLSDLPAGMPPMPAIAAPLSRPLTSSTAATASLGALSGATSGATAGVGASGGRPLQGISPLAPTQLTATQARARVAPGAPIPRARKPRRRWGPLPVSRPVALACMAAVVVLSLLGSYLWRVTHPTPKPQVSSVTTVKVARSGVVNVARLAPLSNAQHPIQSTLPLRTLAGNQSVTADVNAALPQLAPTAPAPAALAQLTTLQSKFGLGQDQVGTDAPIDTSVASSDHYVIEVVDGAIQFYGYNGLPDGPEVAAGAFFAPVVQPQDTLGEPRVFFDTQSRRWVLVMNEVEVQGGAVTNGFFDVAISQSDQPLSVWNLYQISTQEGGGAGCTWADDPRLGSDGAAFYLTGNSFACGDTSNTGSFRGALLWDLPKQAFEAGSGNALLRWSGIFKNADGQPVLGLVPAVQSGSEGTEWLVSDDTGYTSRQPSRNLIVWALLDSTAVESGGTPTLKGVVTPLPFAYADPPAAMQPNSSGGLATGDARIAAAYVVGPHLYTAFTTAVNWKGDNTTRAGVYWADIVTQLNSAPTPTTAKGGNGNTAPFGTDVAQAGVFGFAGGYTFSPALAADRSGDIVLAANVASQSAAPGVVYARHLASDPTGSMGAGSGGLGVLAQGLQPYPGSHWGDYMGISIAALSADGSTAVVWVAAPYMEDFPAHWQTLVWELPLRAG